MKTHQFARPPDYDEPEFERVLRAWKRILERCLDTLAAIDQKDALKWWGSPKYEVAGQRPYELPQNSHTVDKYRRHMGALHMLNDANGARRALGGRQRYVSVTQKRYPGCCRC